MNRQGQSERVPTYSARSAPPYRIRTAVRQLRLTPETYALSDDLRRWCLQNRNRCYMMTWSLEIRVRSVIRTATLVSPFLHAKRLKKGEYGDKTTQELKQGEARSCSTVITVGRSFRYSWERRVQPHSLVPTR